MQLMVWQFFGTKKGIKGSRILVGLMQILEYWSRIMVYTDIVNKIKEKCV